MVSTATRAFLSSAKIASKIASDIWLGFAPADLSAWAKEHNLYAEQNIYFALRNGFQIQIQQFTKRINT